MMVAPSSAPHCPEAVRPTTIWGEPSPTKSVTGSDCTIRFKAAVRERGTPFLTLQPRRAPARGARLAETLALRRLVSIPFITTWTTHMSKCSLWSVLRVSVTDDCSLSACYEEFTAGQQTRMYSFFNTYRANA